MPDGIDSPFTVEDLDELTMGGVELREISAPPQDLPRLRRDETNRVEYTKAFLGIAGDTPKQARLRQRIDVRQSQQAEAAREAVRRLGVDPKDGGLGTNLLLGAVQSGASTLSALQSLSGAKTAAATDRALEEVAAGAEVIDPTFGGKVTRALGGVAADIPLILTGTGPAAAAGTFMRAAKAAKSVKTLAQVTAGVQPIAIREGINTARQQGALEGLAAWGIESSIPALFGGTGVERIFTGQSQNLRGIAQRVLGVTLGAGAEASEEATTELAQAVREYAFGNEQAFDGLPERLAVAATVGGIVGAGFEAVGSRGPRLVAEAQETGDALRAAVLAKAVLNIQPEFATPDAPVSVPIARPVAAPPPAASAAQARVAPPGVSLPEIPAPVPAAAPLTPPEPTTGPIDVPPVGFTAEEVAPQLEAMEANVREIAGPGGVVRKMASGFRIKDAGGMKMDLGFTTPKVLARVASRAGSAGKVYDSMSAGGTRQVLDTRGRLMSRERFVGLSDRARQSILERQNFGGWVAFNPRGEGIPVDADAAAFVTTPGAVLHEGHHALIMHKLFDSEISQAARYFSQAGVNVNPTGTAQALAESPLFQEAFVAELAKYRDAKAAGDAETAQRTPGFLRRVFDRILAAFGIVRQAVESGVQQHPLSEVIERFETGELAARPVQRTAPPQAVPEAFTEAAAKERRKIEREVQRAARAEEQAEAQAERVRARKEREALQELKREEQLETAAGREQAREEREALQELKREEQLETAAGREQARKEREALQALQRDERLAAVIQREQRRKSKAVAQNQTALKKAQKRLSQVERNERSNLEDELGQAEAFLSIAEGDTRAQTVQYINELRAQLDMPPVLEEQEGMFSVEPDPEFTANLANPALTGKGRAALLRAQQGGEHTSVSAEEIDKGAQKLLRRPEQDLLARWETLIEKDNVVLDSVAQAALRALISRTEVQLLDTEITGLRRKILQAHQNRLHKLYTSSRSEAGRTLGTGKDPILTPEQRLQSLYQLMSEPTKDVRDKLDTLYKQRQFTKARALLEDTTAAERDRVLAALEARGISPDSWPDNISELEYFEIRAEVEAIKADKAGIAAKLVGGIMYNWSLLSPASVIRATIGNAFMGPAMAATNFGATMLNEFTRAVTGAPLSTKLGRGRGVVVAARSLRDALVPAFNNAARVWTTSADIAGAKLGRGAEARREGVEDAIDAVFKKTGSRVIARLALEPFTTALGSVDQFTDTIAIQAAVADAAVTLAAEEGLKGQALEQRVKNTLASPMEYLPEDTLKRIGRMAEDMTLRADFKVTKGEEAKLLTERFINKLRKLAAAGDALRSAGSSKFGIGVGQLLVPFYRTIVNAMGKGLAYTPQIAAAKTVIDGVEAAVRGRMGDTEAAEWAKARAAQSFVKMLMGLLVLSALDDEEVTDAVTGLDTAGARRLRRELGQAKETLAVGGVRAEIQAIDPWPGALANYRDLVAATRRGQERGLLEGMRTFIDRTIQTNVVDPLFRNVQQAAREGNTYGVLEEEILRRAIPFGPTRRYVQGVLGEELETRKGEAVVGTFGDVIERREEGTAAAVLTALGARVPDRPPKEKARVLKWVQRTNEAAAEGGAQLFFPAAPQSLPKALGGSEVTLKRYRQAVGNLFWDLVQDMRTGEDAVDFDKTGTVEDLRWMKRLNDRARRAVTRRLRADA